MRFLRAAAAAAMGVGVAIGVAVGAPATAQAANVMEGVYNYMPADGQPGTWTIYPSCVPVVGDLREPLYLPVGCRLHVGPSNGLVGGDARLTGECGASRHRWPRA